MKQGQRLNMKFSMWHVDLIVGLAQAGRTAEQIHERITEVFVPIRRNSRLIRRERVPVYISEIQSICWQSGVKVRAAEQA